MHRSRFQFGHAIVGYVVALVFAFNGLLTGLIDTRVAASRNAFAIVICFGGETPGQLPDQGSHTTKCLCSLSCCCASGLAACNSSEIDVSYTAASVAALRRALIQVVRDFRADHPLHVRSPPAFISQA